MDHEQTGHRDISFGVWHRTSSLQRYLGAQLAHVCRMVDLDYTIYAEHDGPTQQPLALLEVAVDTGTDRKIATVTAQLAKRANLVAYTVLYTIAPHKNVGDERFADITQFRVQRIWPEPKTEWRVFTPQQWAEQLLLIRARGAARLFAESRLSGPQADLLDRPTYVTGTQ